ncbi:MAG: acetylornithine transaminase [Actinomycetota bacterium]|nr:acetylornithine transaminase [Actinomycetota bacterium]
MQDLADARLMWTYRRLPVTFVRGEGMYLYDDRGRKHLDFVAGVAVTALGHAHPAVTEAISTQASKLVHTSNLFYTEPMAHLADRLCELLGWEDGRAFFANSGAEANECAIKLVRRWAGANFGPDRYHMLAAYGAFHGRTLETLAATGQPSKWKPFSPLPPGFTHVPYGDAAAVEAAVTGRESSVLLEPVQGESGVIVPADGYLPEVREICDRHEMAFVADEVQTGLGRTGEWFGFQMSGAVPDVITLAKALGNGLPIGACVARGRLAEAFEPGDHATTMGGGPVVSAVALAVLETMEKENLIENSRDMGRYLKSRLEELGRRHESVREVRGRGLLLAVQLKKESAASVVHHALEEGLLVNNVTPSAVRLCPPLIVNQQQCDEGVEILDKVLMRVGDGEE